MSSLKICPQCAAEYELDQRFCPKDGTTLRLQNESADLVGSIVADRYHVLRKLGEGGMGQVYLAEHVKMGRRSALKVMNPALVNDADAISRFNREASNASRINHPNVAAIYDFGETADGIIYLAMEVVDGPPLTKLLAETGPLPPSRDAVQKVTKTGLVVGTPEYMSPEQLAGDRLDGRSDIYALALVAFNMLTGQLPFPAETAQESMIKRLTEPPKRRQPLAAAATAATMPEGHAPPATGHAPRRMLFAAGGLVLVGVLGTAMVMRRDPGKVRQSGNVTPAGQAPSDVSPPRDSTRYAGPIDSSAFGSKPAVNTEAAARVSAAEVSERLDSLEKVVSGDATPTQADGVLRELHQMRGRIRGNQQIVQAGIVEAFAQSTRHHQAEACAALRRIEPAARGTRRANYVTTAIAAASCP